MTAINADQKKMIDKIVKLLAKADNEGATPEEAKSFANAAAELMAKYNISLIETVKDEEFTTVSEQTGRKVAASYESSLLNAIARLTGVFMVVSNKNEFKYSGRPSNIENFQYMRDVVYLQRTAAWREFYPTRWGNHPGATELAKWKLGFAYGAGVKIQNLIE